MVYFLCNLLLTAFILWLSFLTADRTKGDAGNMLVDLQYILLTSTALMALASLAMLFAPERLVILLGRLHYAFVAIFLVHSSYYCVQFPLCKMSKIRRISKYSFDLLAFYLVFMQFKSWTISSITGITVIADTMLNGKLGIYFPWTFFDLYNFIYIVAIPGFCCLISLVKAENIASRVDAQRIMLSSTALLNFFLGYALYAIAVKYIPMLYALQGVILTASVLLLFCGAVQSELWNLKSVVGSALQMLLLMIIPAMIMGFLFLKLWPSYDTNKALFYLVLALAGVIFMTYSHQVSKLFSASTYFRSSLYANVFETEMAAIDFDEDTQVIIKKIQEIFARNIGSSSLNILIDTGHGELATAYSSTNLSISLSSNNMALDSVLNSKLQVVFRRQVNAGFAFGSAKAELLSILDKAQADALIILNEGRHIVGIIFLGPKQSGNAYSDYDYKTFNKLYSYFFVVGYFIRNIANESVIGTVNREIKMSSQIISSIQENMDFIRNPKIDAGYLMVPSHNIGGEFIDFIRLTEEKHIFVIGGLSGKGISASMSMVILKSIIRTFLKETKDFRLLVQKVNEFIKNDLPKGTFFQGLFGLLDFAENTMYYINCAIPALFVYTQAYNNVIEIQGEGRVLGFVSDIMPYLKIKKIRLEKGDIVLACTDGLVEAHSLRGDEYGKSRVQQAMMENSSYPAQKMVQFVYDNLMAWTQKTLEDDVSIMVLKMQKQEAS